MVHQQGGILLKTQLHAQEPGVRQCCNRAVDIRRRAHAPYSRFHVGCAIRGADGEVHVGVNVENAAYPLCRCAEGNAIAGMVAQGVVKVEYLAIALKGGGSPCGGCRQIIWEFCQGDKDVKVYMVDDNGSDNPWVSVMTIGELLPEAFNL
ncbi:MAG: cytidine deaminase [Candidatus Doudnabacteria bacterium]